MVYFSTSNKNHHSFPSYRPTILTTTPSSNLFLKSKNLSDL